MPVAQYTPHSPGRRHASKRLFDDITKTEPEKSLVVIKKRHGGRTRGTITVRHRGGGAKRYIRIVDFKRDNLDVPGTVIAIEYDPNRGSRIALVQFPREEKRYILAPQGVAVGDTVCSYSAQGEFKPGNAFALRSIPAGMNVHNIEMKPKGGGKLVRGAGAYAQLLGVEGEYAQFKLPSGEVRVVHAECRATLGMLSNPDHHLVSLGTAGRSRNLGRRPVVRGKVMNPVDHPHGGGEGRNPIGLRYPKTPWGKHALGVKTRKAKRFSNRFILQRRPKK